MQPIFSSRWSLVAALCWAFCFPGITALGVTPESPEVKACIDRGLSYIAKFTDARLGGRCMIALAFYKHGLKDHPRIKEAIDACKSGTYKTEDNYSLGIAMMFLTEVAPDTERSLIEDMLKELLSRQMKNGGWGYPGRDTGDTSQTQYAVLGMWMAEGNGIAVPMTAQENVANWLLRTQNPDGGWGYQGKDPGGFQRVAQQEVNGSLTAAGLSSMYIVADQLHMTTPQEPKPDGPPALRVIRDNAGARTPRTKRVDRGLLLKSLQDGDQWFPAHLNHNEIQWFYYYLYALERYQSFRELAKGEFEKEPKWYNAYFEMLKQKQDPKEGFWDGGVHEGREVGTAFAILFLLRSSKKAIVKIVNLGDGTLLGGMGLPPNVADVKEKDGKLIETPLSGGIEELLSVLEDDSNPELSRLAESNQAIELSSDVTKRAGQIVKLRALVSAPAFESRLVAVRSLGKTGLLDNVPLLLYALTDPDIRVVKQADAGLRFISRKFDGFGFPEDPNPPKAEIDKLRTKWKQWYLSVSPDAQLLD